MSSDGRSLAMANGWTGGQFAIVRSVIGLWLCLHFAQLAPWAAELFSGSGAIPRAADSPLLLPVNPLAWYDAPWFTIALTALGSLAGLGIAAGMRSAAVVAWAVSACLLGRDPLIANPGLPYVGWMLLAIASMPTARFGDPDWRMPRTIFALAWIAMTVGYAYSGWTKLSSPSWIDGSALRRVLDNPLARPGILREALLAAPDGALRWATWGTVALELAAPLGLWRPLRAWTWTPLLAMHLGLMGVLAFADLSVGMVLLHLFTADPAWLRAKRTVAVVFYDGGCGLCHRFVTFCLGEDRAGVLRFAPLHGDTFALLPHAVRSGLPDSIAVRLEDDHVLDRTRAVAAVLDGLGGGWRIAAIAIRCVPRPIADRVYDGIAAIRHRLFHRPSSACPMLPPALRTRFLP